MSFDTSRFGFHPWNDYFGVVMQQGRVQIDADWNEWVAQLGRRLQADTLDTVGRAVVPRSTPEGFHILANGGALSIGVGRMYVDGLLAENHGAEPSTWDTRLAELGGTAPVPLLEQPYLPYNSSNQTGPAHLFNPPDLSGGPHLVYLDVWQREVTHWQAPDLVEKAVGVDTTGRLQTVWQVRVLRNVANTTCATPNAEVPGWAALTAPSGGRLSNDTVDMPGDFSPCLAPPAVGYKGLENQLYRVEIHRGGPQVTATFKWSRDNATVATRVSQIQGGKRLVVESIGRDDVLGFHAGEWIEILDDWHELHGLPGHLHRILPSSGVHAATRSITLEVALPAGLFPVNGQGMTDPARHTRIRRWDQSVHVRREDGSAFHNLDANGVSDGIPLPPAGTRLVLENGIVVDFSVIAGGQFRTGDHWVFAARTEDASIEPLTAAPPRGIHHHYARLAVVTLPNTETDCRVFWPPAVGGQSCNCTVCVHPTEHNDGTATIQQAIDAVRARGGGTVCLDVGTYLLSTPLNLENVSSLLLRGQGWATVLQPAKAGGALLISRGIGVTVENLSVVGVAAGSGTTAMIDIRHSMDVNLRHLTIAAGGPGDATAAGIAFSGLVLAARVEDCIIVAEQCIVSAADGEQPYLLTMNIRVIDNVLMGSQRALRFSGNCLHGAQTRIADNLILVCNQAGVELTGAALPAAVVTIEGNVMQLSGVGVIGGTDSLRIENNQITASPGRLEADGIRIQQGLDSGTLEGLTITGNRLRGQGGHGISVRHALGKALMRCNAIDNTLGGAIIMGPKASAAYLGIENNQFTDIGADFKGDQQPFFGVLLLAVERADVVGNVFDGVARQAGEGLLCCALQALGCGEVRAADNRLYGIGPSKESAKRVIGIGVGPGFQHVAIQNNNVARRATETEDVSIGSWQPLLIIGGGAATHGNEESFATKPVSVFGVAVLSVKGGQVYLSANRLGLRATASISVQVSGNRMCGDNSLVPATQIMGVQSCQFVQNDIHITSGDSAGLLAGVVMAEHACVANNRLLSSVGDNDVFLLFTNKGQFAVVGNLGSGAIRANNAVLPAPWDALNVKI
jgi:hypothetical protein